MHSIKTPIITLLKDVSNIADMIATQNWSNSRRLYVVKALPRVQLKKKTNKKKQQQTNGMVKRLIINHKAKLKPYFVMHCASVTVLYLASRSFSFVLIWQTCKYLNSTEPCRAIYCNQPCDCVTVQLLICNSFFYFDRNCFCRSYNKHYKPIRCV